MICIDKRSAVLCAILSAALYALSTPLSKLLLIGGVTPIMLAGLLYVGAGIGTAILRACAKKAVFVRNETPLNRKDLPYVVLMTVLDIAAPILLMLGLNSTNASTVSLLNNFEIVSTALVARFIFKEKIDARVWLALALIFVACMMLGANDITSFSFHAGALLVLAAAVCWGFENNVTRKLSDKDPLQIVTVKGLGSGAGSLMTAFIAGGIIKNSSLIVKITFWQLACALILGFVAYGVSITLYIMAQRHIGAAKTSAYYAVSPFIGALMGILINHDGISVTFFVSLLLMGIGTWLVSFEKKA